MESVSQRGGGVKIRQKNRSNPRFYLVIAFCLVFTAIRSTFGGVRSNGEHHETPQHHNNFKSAAQHQQQQHEEHQQGESSHHPDSSHHHHQIHDEENEGHLHEGNHHENYSEHHNQHHHQSTHSPEHEKDYTTETPDEEDRCIRPSIEQFPKPWLSQKARVYGGFMIYVIATAYTFLALAIICDEFFVPSLDIMAEVLKISPDVAGATFMAAGSSAPELATALIGVFIAKDDIGVSGVIGSAVFNIMFVISICALLTPTVLYLNWWPLVRDCFFYMVSILALLGTIADETITWFESTILLLLYGVYCYVMYMNEVLEAWAYTLPIPIPVHVAPVRATATEKSQLVAFKNAGLDQDGNPIQQNQSLDAEYNMEGIQQQPPGGEGVPGERKKVSPKADQSISVHFAPPEEGGGLRKFLWAFSLPLIYLFYYTVPDCRLERWKTWYILTFTGSMVWIAVFSYIMVWMITVIGYTVGVPDTVMGLTFVAAGVSVPDALSSLAVVKEGFGDMAVSNAVGSNVFDILICLGLPWFLSTAIFNPGVPVRVISKGLTYSTLTLLSTVAFLLIATHYNGWKLDKKYGVILMVWYFLFMIFSCLYELNIFGNYNPPECPSNY